MTSELNLPTLPRSPMFDSDGTMILEWQEFFRDLYTRTGGHEAPTNNEIINEATGTVNQIVVAVSDGVAITISISDSYLPVHALGTTNQVVVTNNGNGKVTISLPQNIDTGADVQFNSVRVGVLYFGDPTVNGSFRLIPSGTKLNIERRESGAWVKEGAFGPRS